MSDVQAKARFRIMMLIAELQELAEASPDPLECARVESVLLHTIEALGKKSEPREGPMMSSSRTGRA